MTRAAKAALAKALVASLGSAGGALDSSEESVELLMGSASSVAADDVGDVSTEDQESLLSLSLGLLANANSDASRVRSMNKMDGFATFTRIPSSPSSFLSFSSSVSATTTS